MEEQMKYYAFISYNSADEKWAKWLQHSLEYYHVPSALCKEYSNLPKKIRPVFWYKQDLSGTKLKDALSKELENSKFLIVICSPDSAKSEWVNDEVQSFIKQGKGDKIIPFIVGGTPHAQNPNEECFPPALLGLKRDEEIRGIDIRRKEGKLHALVDVIATMFGIRFDELWERHKKRRRRIVFLSILSLLAVLAVCVAWRVSVKKELITQAKFIAAEAEKLAENGDVYDATRLMTYTLKNNKEAKNIDEIEYVISLLNNYDIPDISIGTGYHKAAFNPKDKSYITTKKGDVATIWSSKNEMENSFDVRDAYFNSVDYHPSGEYIIIASDKGLYVRSVSNNKMIQDTIILDEYLNSAKFSHNGEYIMAFSSKHAYLFKVDDKKFTLKKEIQSSKDSNILSAMLIDDGKRIIVAEKLFEKEYKTDTIHIAVSDTRDITNKVSSLFMVHDKSVKDAFFHPNGNFFTISDH